MARRLSVLKTVSPGADPHPPEALPPPSGHRRSAGAGAGPEHSERFEPSKYKSYSSHNKWICRFVWMKHRSHTYIHT